MADLVTRPEYELPANMEDLSRFVLVGREKLAAVKAEIRAIEKVGLAKAVREQKLQAGQALSEALLDAEVRIGQLMREISKASGGNHGNQYTSGKNDNGVDFGKSFEAVKNPVPEVSNSDSSAEKNVGQPITPEIITHSKDKTSKTKSETKEVSTSTKTKAEVIREAGFTQKQAERFQQLAEHPELVERAKAEARENDDIVSRSLVLNMIKTQKKAEQIEEAKAQIARQESRDYEPILYIGDGLKHQPETPYDLLLTDPPYSTDIDDIDRFAQSWLPQALKKVKATGSAYVFIGAYPEELRAYLNVKIPEPMTLKQVLIWTYKNTLGNNPKDRYKQNYQACLYYRGVEAPSLNCPLTNEQWAVQEINAPDGRIGDRYHAWQKPLELAERFIRHSTKQGDVVFDPFACTGTFLLAASKLGRRSYGFELKRENAEIARKRGVTLIE